MKLKTFSILTFSILINIFCFGQSEVDKYESLIDWNTDTVQLHKILRNGFVGGEENFYKTIYKNIKYPLVASRNCKEGVVLIQLSFENSTQKVEFVNKIGSEFDKEVIKAFSHVEKLWNSVDDKIKLNISIRFSINPDKEDIIYNYSTIQISGYQMGGNLICDALCDYRTTNYLLEKVKYSMDYEDYESAVLYLKELKRRFPFNKAYQKLYKQSWMKIKE
jgi:hypothetical protein